MPKPQVQANGHLKLTDDDYIRWAQRSRWTVNEAVSLLHGELPEGECSRVELIERFPDARRLLESPWGDDGFYESPAMWVERASRAAVKIDEGWQAQFPYRLKEKLFPPIQPDYRDFINCFVLDVKSPLRDLVDYALGERFEWPNNIPQRASSLLKRIHRELPAEDQVRTGKKMGDVLVSPRWFVETCLRLDGRLDKRCSSWADWTRTYPKFVAWLNKRPKKSKDDRIPSGKGQDAYEDVEAELSQDKTITIREAAVRAQENNPYRYKKTSVETLLRYHREVRKYYNE